MSKHTISIFTALLLGMPLPMAFAQTPTVSAGVTGYTAISNGGGTIPESERVAIDVTRNDGTLHSEARGEGGSAFVIPGIPFNGGTTNSGLTSAFATGFASADPGVLRVYGADLAVAIPPISPPQVPGTLNTATVNTNISAGASFTDYLTVNHAGLALGTEVQVPFVFVAELVSNYPLGYPPYSLHPISAYASFMIPGLGPQNFSTETINFFPWTRTTLANGDGFYVVRGEWSFSAHVGDVLPIGATFGISGQANVNASTYEREFGGFADGRNTAGVWLGSLADGLTLTSASGHDYTIDPTLAAPTVPPMPPVAAVPEPETYAMLLAGLAGMGWIVRRRRASAPRH